MDKPPLVLFNVKNREITEIQLKTGGHVIDKMHLTAGQDFDILLIRTLDKIFQKNKIVKLSLKSVKIRGETEPQALSGMILRSVAKALNA